MNTSVNVTTTAGTTVSVDSATGSVVVDVTPTPSVEVDVTVGSASSGGSGDVIGPASSTDNAIARFNGTTGKVIQNSGITIADGASGTLAGSNSGDVTLGTASGLSLAGQVLSLGVASAGVTGALSGTDWSTFNGKQAAGSYLTALTGDVTASGPGSAAATLANTAVTPGSYTLASITVDAKGRVTSAATGSGAGITQLTGAITAGPGTGSQVASIANDAVTTAKINNGAVNSSKLATNAVTTAAITDANVTLAKIANAAAGSKLVGSGSLGSGNAYSEITLGTGLSMSGTTISVSGAGSGDMTKAVYDPQASNHISGATVSGNQGGLLIMTGGVGGIGGTITTVGGSVGTGSNGGAITTSGGSASSAGGGGIITTGGNVPGANGGGIVTSGNNFPGGGINTSDGGGSIDTTGTGSIGFGASGTRTTVNGQAASNITVLLPAAAGTLLNANGDGSSLTGITAPQVGALAPNGDGSALTGITPGQVGALAPNGDGSALTGITAAQVGAATTGDITIGTALSNSGITPAADGTYASPTSITIQNGIITAIS